MKQSSYGQARLLLHDNLMNDTMSQPYTKASPQPQIVCSDWLGNI
jgi:hypothetical protein